MRTPTPATVVLNPAARCLRRPGFAARLEQALATALERATILKPASPAAARAAIAEVREGLLVVAGGDGAINLAVNALADPAPALAIIPSGTANDLARALGLPAEVDSAAAALGGQIRHVDVLTVNGRRFCTTGGLGLPALVAQAANTVKRQRGTSLLGHHLYAAVAGSQILARRRLRRRIRLDWVCADTGAARHLEAEVYGVLVTNVGAVAGSLRLCEARPDDGVFEICLLPATGRPRLLRLLLALARGRPARPGTLPALRARAARLQVAEPTPFLGDGEILARTSAFELGVLPAALCVVAP
ncbi:MAG: diacylglycerol kinase family protein [bacterium]